MKRRLVKYLPTPINLVSIYYIYMGVVSYVNMDWDRAELGALFPFIYWGIAIIAFGIDLFLRLVMKEYYGLLYLSQFLLLILFLFWLMDIGEI